jgi:hypothetical protein
MRVRRNRRRDTRPLLDRGYVAYPLFIAIGVIVWYAFAGAKG